MARDERRYAGLLFVLGGFLGGQMQASNVVNARSPEHGSRGGRGFSSDGIELAECGEGCVWQAKDSHYQSVEFSVGHKRWNQVKVDVLGDNALDVMEAGVGWDSMLQEAFFFLSRDGLPFDQSEQCLRALGTSWATKLLEVGKASFFQPRKPLQANSQSISGSRVWCRSSVHLGFDRVAMGLSMSYISFPVAPSAGFHQYLMSGSSLLTSTLSIGFLALGSGYRGGDVRGRLEAPVELSSGETV